MVGLEHRRSPKVTNPYFCCMMLFLSYWREAVFIAFCLIILTQLFYYFYFFLRLARYQPGERASHEERPVSVIVCARNEADNILKNLPGILVQNYRTTHEVVLVNDNSSDETKFLVDELRKTFRNLMPIELTQEAKHIAGKKFPLSMGIKSAKYETLLLTDADCVPASENWIRCMQHAYSNDTEIVLGYGAYRKRAGILNKIIRFETFHSALQYFSYALAGIPYMGVGRNLSYRRDVFFRNKGFSSINQVPGGDDDLFINQVANKNNTSIVIDHESHTLSEPKKTWAEWFNQKTRHYSTAKFYQSKHKLLLGIYSATQFLTFPFFITSLLFFNWWLALCVFMLRAIVQGFVYRKTMQRLNEADLWPAFLLLDIWMCFYYLLFLPSLFRRPKKTWN